MTLLWSVLVAVVAIAVIAWIISPLESLLWWGRTGSRRGAALSEQDGAAPAPVVPAGASSVPGAADDAPAEMPTRCYVVYLSGIAAFDDDQLPRAERPVLHRLERTFGDLRVVGSIYPYAVDNRGLVDDRPSAPLWRWFEGRRGSRWLGLLSLAVNVRNVYQVLVSADPRYGPVFSAGIAQTLWRQLHEAGYRTTSGARVVLLGWSGGAQIAAGAAWYLGAAGARVTLLSLGGIFSADPGLDQCERIVHLVGSRDWQCRLLGPLAFPGRRRWARHSAWGRALADGRAEVVDVGPMKHVGRGSYLSGAKLPDGRRCTRATSEAIADALRRHGLATPRESSNQGHHID